ncbi:MAG: hypothetical protein ABIQ43_01745, partial [Sphingomonas sp.]
LVKPFRQGDLDSLCGLYAILNGMRLVLPPDLPITKLDCRQLFREGLAFLQENDCGDAARHGIPSKDWHALARFLLKHARRNGVADFRCGKRSVRKLSADRDEAIEEIEKSVARGVPVAVELGKALNHYTVVAQTTDERWMLYDSHDHSWINKRHVGYEKPFRHILGRRAVFFEVREGE